MQYFEYSWESRTFDQYAANIVKYINNATNVTTTSTIQGGGGYASSQCSRKCCSDRMGLSNGYKNRWNALHFVRTPFTVFLVLCLFSLTPISREYPRNYAGIGRIKRYSQSPIINRNKTVGCVIATTSVTRGFLLREYISNGLELSAFIDRDIDKNCLRIEASPPQALVRVSSLTATMTNYVDRPETTSAADKAAPSSLPSPPIASRTIPSRLTICHP